MKHSRLVMFDGGAKSRRCLETRIKTFKKNASWLLRSGAGYVKLLLDTVEKPWNYRGRAVTSADIAFIRELIAADPEAGRCSLSRRLCQVWGWKQPNGVLRDM